LLTSILTPKIYTAKQYVIPSISVYVQEGPNFRVFTTRRHHWKNSNQAKSRYLNLFSDRAFRRVFGCERDKDITLSFLNAVLGETEQIVDFSFASTAYSSDNPSDRGVVLDLQCQTIDGRRIVVELQKRPQAYFRERTLYYATWPIQAQGKRGDWDYNINAVYVVSILDFLVDRSSQDDRIISRKMILDVDTWDPWTDKLHFVSIEIPRFKKTLAQCTTLLDKWFYVLKNLHRLMEKPKNWQDEVFEHLFALADKTRFEMKDLVTYEQSETEYDHMKNALDYAIATGEARGKACGEAIGEARGEAKGDARGFERGLELDKIDVIQGMLAKGCEWSFIKDITHLDQAGYEALRLKHNK
jgi:predicted transposase/invertase (TIGR01784 family)